MNDRENPDNYITAKELSKFLSISVGTLATWRTKKKLLPYYKWHGRIVYYMPEILEIIEKARVDVKTI